MYIDKRFMPNFTEWSRHILDREDVAIALEQAFNQGLSLGYLQGFEDGEKIWQNVWDADKGWLDGKS